MALLQIEHLSFGYALGARPVLQDVSLAVEAGAFVLLCGTTGSGKTTLLRQLKKEIRPAGELQGTVYYRGKPLDSYDENMVREIGMVFQNPDAQCVAGSVWQEMAFSLENQQVPVGEMRRRIAEMASFFGMEQLMEKSIQELSGGEKQLVSLASVLLLRPSVILLDEPMAQLDPVAAQAFLKFLKQVNEEFSITVLIAEHHTEELFAAADRVVFLQDGQVFAQGTPEAVCRALYAEQNLRRFVPRVSAWFLDSGKPGDVPFTLKAARQAGVQGVRQERPIPQETERVLECRGISFRYEKQAPIVLKDLDLSLQRGELLALMGANGAGKSTLLKILLGLEKPQRGKVKIDDGQRLGYLAQNPMLHFTHDTVRGELYDYAKEIGAYDAAEIGRLVRWFGLEEVLEMHPYDLSGGQQQKTALLSVLLLRPTILLLDEPVKGMDAAFKEELAGLLRQLQEEGKTILMVTHDIAFAERTADRCAMLFGGEITAVQPTTAFFADNYFYTTAYDKLREERH